jgi:excisionase family DNA binding protein
MTSAIGDLANLVGQLVTQVARLEKAVKAPERKAWKPREVAAMTGLGYDTVLELIHEGRLRAVQVGQLYIVPTSEVDLLLGESKAA